MCDDPRCMNCAMTESLRVFLNTQLPPEGRSVETDTAAMNAMAKAMADILADYEDEYVHRTFQAIVALRAGYMAQSDDEQDGGHAQARQELADNTPTGMLH